MRTTGRDNESVVARAAAVLCAFRPDEDGVGVNELARRTGLATSTVSRLVRELVAVHFLERDARSVRLGVRMFEFGELAAGPRDLRRAAEAHLSDLRRATGYTVHLAVLDGTDVVYLDILPSRQGPPLPSRVGGRVPAHATGVGKALLAHAAADVLDAVLATGLPAVGPRTVTAPDALREELARIRGCGTAYDREESAAGASCAASPILSAAGTAVAAVSVSGWSGHLDLRRAGPAVQMAALGIGRRLPGPSS